jgi:hypothetical protein
MAKLTHATFAAKGYDMRTKRKELDQRIQDEIIEAKRIQREHGCSWSEALRLAGRVPAPE